jgi:uncharacterized protein
MFIVGIVLLLTNFAIALTSIEAAAVDAEGKGILSTISVTATPGEGDIFVSITPLTGIDTQHSEKIAVSVAATIAKVDAKKFNLLFKIESSAEVVDGPSAGAALTLLSYGELTGKKIRNDITITGTIDKEGNVGKIGGVFEKAKAVAESKTHFYKVFMIPRGQRVQSGIDIIKYAAEKWKLQVVEVDNVKDAIKNAFETDEGSVVEVKERAVPELNLIPYKPTDESKLFKEIASGEIREAKDRLRQWKGLDITKASIEEALNLSEKLIAKNYFYSGANTAFIGSVSLDEIAFANMSSREIRGKLKELKTLADNMSFATQTDKNFEWVVGAKLRYHWAKEKLELATDGIAIGAYPQVTSDLAIASSWLRAARKLNAIALQNENGTEMKDIYFRNLASKMIEDAKGLDADGLLDEETKDHLNTAILTFTDADYLAAAFDASFAISYSDALDLVADSGYAEIAQKICKADAFEITCSIFKDKVHDSLWGELYYAHALYNFQESNRTRDMQSVINGVKLLKLSVGFDILKKEALEALKNPSIIEAGPSPIASVEPSREVEVEVVAIPENSYRDLILGSIGAIIVILILYVFVLKHATPETQLISSKTRVEKAEELLLDGKISDRSFEYFRNKYGKAKEKNKKRKK